MSEDKQNYANQFTILLFVAILVNLACYGLPDSIFGLQIKKVDLFSDIRKPTQDDSNTLALSTDNEGVNLLEDEGNALIISR